MYMYQTDVRREILAPYFIIVQFMVKKASIPEIEGQVGIAVANQYYSNTTFTFEYCSVIGYLLTAVCILNLINMN